MGQRVVLVSDGHRVEGCGPDGELVNRFLAHLGSRAFSPATVRAYAYDLLNFLRFLAGRDARLADVVATDLFDYLACPQRPAGTGGQAVVRLGAGRGAAPATMNRRIAAVRGLFEFAVMTGARAENPAPAAAAARVAGARGCGRVRGGPADLPGPGDHPGDAAGRAARRGGPVAAAGRCGHGAAPGAGDREGRQGACRPGGRRVLRRAGRLPARGTPGVVPGGGMLRGAARPDLRAAADRGRAAPDLPHPPAGLGGASGAAAPAQAYLRDRTR